MSTDDPSPSQLHPVVNALFSLIPLTVYPHIMISHDSGISQAAYQAQQLLQGLTKAHGMAPLAIRMILLAVGGGILRKVFRWIHFKFDDCESLLSRIVESAICICSRLDASSQTCSLRPTS